MTSHVGGVDMFGMPVETVELSNGRRQPARTTATDYDNRVFYLRSRLSKRGYLVKLIDRPLIEGDEVIIKPKMRSGSHCAEVFIVSAVHGRNILDERLVTLRLKSNRNVQRMGVLVTDLAWAPKQ
jgi:hypothetical protein